ncbi:MAG: hypothetical protein NTY38_13270 [Acidobacteria bacterium]|nr:hypothetical protein [Acidobacteriota bacterium]
MRLQLLALTLLAATLAASSSKDKTFGDATYSNDTVEIAATVLLDKDSIRNTLGAELGAGYCIVRVTVTPKGDDKMRVDFDDFTLLSYKDGQRSQPFQPSQIAGNATMVVTTRSTGGGGMAGENNGPIWGGMGGGVPRRGPGSGGGIGNTASEQTASASIEKGNATGKSPLMVALEKQMSPMKETTEPVTGLLYFSLEGKQKPKNLALLYKGQAGRFSMEFH